VRVHCIVLAKLDTLRLQYLRRLLSTGFWHWFRGFARRSSSNTPHITSLVGRGCRDDNYLTYLPTIRRLRLATRLPVPVSWTRRPVCQHF